MLGDGIEQGLERVLEELHGIGEELVGDFLHGDASGFEIGHGFVSGVDTVGEARAKFAVIAEGVEGCGRDGVHSVRTDEFFDVDYVAVFRIFGASAGPEESLRLCALG